MRQLFRTTFSHVVPAYFGIAPGRRRPGEGDTLYGGSAAIVQLPSALVAVTCAHVIDGFRMAVRDDERFHFQLGSMPLPVLDMIIAEEGGLDLATIDLSTLASVAVLSERDDETPLFALTPQKWPPSEVTRGEQLIVTGFPGGDYRTHVAYGIVDAPSFTLGAVAVDVDRAGIVIELRRDQWLTEDFQEVSDSIRELDVGGLSGCPVFAVRSSLEFVGVVTMNTGSLDGLRVRSTTFIGADGFIL